jgi:2-amino-4-hydroxy-6-hydroxymethyldihydropteridine diphosphokinase
MMNQVVVALGSNIEKEVNLPRAVRLLSDMCDVVAVASVYETAPVGLLEQPIFFNTAVMLHTPLSPAEIKRQYLSEIERQLKRVRQADPNAPRTIDLDIVLFNDEVLDYAGEDGRFRHIPEKDLLKFPHVAVPVAELLPEMPHPETGERLQTIANRLLDQDAQNGPPSLWKRDDFQIAKN